MIPKKSLTSYFSYTECSIYRYEILTICFLVDDNKKRKITQ